MSNVRKVQRRLISALLIGTLLSAGAGAAMAQEDTLRVRLASDIRTTEPGVNRDAITDAVLMHMVEGLVGYKDDATIGNLLAKSVDLSEDGKVYTFHLREDVKFSNGAPLTADDVLFSWGRYTDPANAWRCLPDVNGEGLSKVISVEAPDEHTVVYTLEQPAALFLATLARTDCTGTGIYSKDSLGADGKWVAPIGTGPFTLDEWKQGQYVELVKNDNYVALDTPRDGYIGDKTPLVDKVRFVIIPDDSAAKAALLSGGLDVIPDVANTDVAELSDNPAVIVDKHPGMSLSTYNFQTRDPLLSDVRIRKAIELSLDIPQIVEVVTEGLAQPGRSVVPRPSPYFGDSQSAVEPRNIEEAKKLLAEAGYNGQPIKWLTTKQQTGLFDTAVMAQAMAAEAGINIEIEVLDWASLSDHYTDGSYTAASYSYSARLDPALSFDMMSGNKDEQPRKLWENPKALELIAKAKQVSDPTERKAIFDELEAMFRTDVPMIPLYSGIKVSAVGTNVEGYSGWTIGYPRAWGVSLKAAN